MSEYVYAKAEPLAAAEAQVAQVVAPSTLSAGYTFLATINGRTVSVVVPEGGVKEGQTFIVPVPTPSAPLEGVSAGEATPLNPSYNDFVNGGGDEMATTPRGFWKDGLCACCAVGPCHPSLWNAVCCPQILMAQVLTRMNMNWLGDRNSADSNNTFKRVLCLLIAYWVLALMWAPPAPEVDIVGDDMNPEVIATPANVPFWQGFLYQLLNFSFGIYTLIVLIKLRRAVRERYAIPSQTCCDDSLEDCCCSLFCGCCTVAQLARHTADYHERRALCCSSTGLPPNPPMVIVV